MSSVICEDRIVHIISKHVNDLKCLGIVSFLSFLVGFPNQL